MHRIAMSAGRPNLAPNAAKAIFWSANLLEVWCSQATPASQVAASLNRSTVALSLAVVSASGRSWTWRVSFMLRLDRGRYRRARAVHAIPPSPEGDGPLASFLWVL